jgi:hypothetical protein
MTDAERIAKARALLARLDDDVVLVSSALVDATRAADEAHKKVKVLRDLLLPVVEPPPPVPPLPPPAPPVAIPRRPTGTITTPAPWNGRPLNIPWSNITRHDAVVWPLAAKYGVNPFVIAAFMVIETGGNHTRDGKVIETIDGHDNKPAVGLMQVKPYYWQHLAPHADPHTIPGNVELACAVLKWAVAKHGTWGEALKKVYHPGVSPNGTTPEKYEDCAGDLVAIQVVASRPPIPSPIPPPTPTRDPVFGRVPLPKNFEARVITNNTAWDDLGPRAIKGICLHRMLGTLVGTDGYFRGEARNRALTDFGVGQGKVYQWNLVGGPVNGKVRSPHANGPASDVEGDGGAWMARNGGVVAVNRDCVSIEIEGLRYDSPFLDNIVTGERADPHRIVADLGAELLPCGWPVGLERAMDDGADDIGDRDFARVCELVARLCDLGTWPWHEWPKHNGVHALLSHHEFGPKECAGSAVLRRVPEIIATVGAMLRYWQVDSVVNPQAPKPWEGVG